MTLPPLLHTLSGYVSGRFLAPGEARFDVVNPASATRLVSLPSFGEKEATLAVEAAEPLVSAPASLARRAGWLRAIADAHEAHADALARIITLENGKPLAEARGEVAYAAGFYRAAIDSLPKLLPRTLAAEPKGHRWTIHARPAGVAGLITPWNFPLGMIAKKVAGAIAAGAPFVVKPAEKTPLSCIALFHILAALDLEPGFANLVFGDAPAIGRVLCEHPAVRVISFTGSTGVGKLLSAQSAPHVKRLALELGGNAPFIVFGDADLDRTCDELMSNKFRCAGQTCVCTNRVYVHRSIAAAFTARVSAAVAALRVGPGLDAGTQVGPLIDKTGFDKVRQLVSDALDRGARGETGELPPQLESAAPAFYPPTVLSGVTHAMDVTKDEVFGPVVPIITFDSEDEVVNAANDTPYGLAAYVFSHDRERAKRVAARLRFGHVGIDTGTGPTPEAPFGGMKQSGLGREGGDEGVLEFVELQTLPEPA